MIIIIHLSRKFRLFKTGYTQFFIFKQSTLFKTGLETKQTIKQKIPKKQTIFRRTTGNPYFLLEYQE
jgi:hypothetical protein